MYIYPQWCLDITVVAAQRRRETRDRDSFNGRAKEEGGCMAIHIVVAKQSDFELDLCSFKTLWKPSWLCRNDVGRRRRGYISSRRPALRPHHSGLCLPHVTPHIYNGSAPPFSHNLQPNVPTGPSSKRTQFLRVALMSLSQCVFYTVAELEGIEPTPIPLDPALLKRKNRLKASCWLEATRRRRVVNHPNTGRERVRRGVDTYKAERSCSREG